MDLDINFKTGFKDIGLLRGSILINQLGPKINTQPGVCKSSSPQFGVFGIYRVVRSIPEE